MDSPPRRPMTAMSLAQIQAAARHAWSLSEPEAKCAAVRAMAPLLEGWQPEQAQPGDLLDPGAVAVDDLEPGRPARPELVSVQSVPRRSPGSPAGLAALLHAIAHIEFNAIDLALDAVWRYPAMPASFARDWLSVAVDEERHFGLLTDALDKLDTAYGDFPAHDGLWEMARRTAPDLLSRMALVPRVLEARGLDATPAIQRKLNSAGQRDASALLQIILDEEVRHVALGNDWFQLLCVQQQRDPEQTFRDLMLRFDAPRPKGNMNRQAREAAGFSAAELDWLEGQS